MAIVREPDHAPANPSRRRLAASLGAVLGCLGACGPGGIRPPRVRGRVERGTLEPGAPVVHIVHAEAGDRVVVQVLDGTPRFALRDPAGGLMYDSATTPGPTTRFTGTATMPGPYRVELRPAGRAPVPYAVEIGLS